MHPTFGEEDQIHGVEAALPKTPKEKWDNFVYHYKWVAVAVVFAIVAVIICTLQICNKTSYDGYVIYAGPKSLLTVQSNTIEKHLCGITEDYDGNGENAVNFYSLYIEDVDKLRDSGRKDAGTLAAKSRTNYDTFTSEMQVGTYLICLLSPELFDELDKETNIFVPIVDADPNDGNDYGVFSSYDEISDVIPADAFVGLHNCGLKLSKLPLYDMPGYKSLPGDTVVCLRLPSAIAAWYTGNSDTERYEQHAELFRSLVLSHPESEDTSESQ